MAEKSEVQDKKFSLGKVAATIGLTAIAAALLALPHGLEHLKQTFPLYFVGVQCAVNAAMILAKS